MKSSIANHLLLASALLSPFANVTGREIEIRHAAEIEFETEVGHYYQLQISTDLAEWHDVDDRVYGHGGRERRLRSSQPDDGSPREYFRVIVTDAPVGGLAPDSFEGVILSLDDRPGGDLMRFSTETEGVDLGLVDDPFVYTFTRTGENEVRIETHPPKYYFDRINSYLFTFTGPDSGTWVRDEYRKGSLKDRDMGVFHFVPESGVVVEAPDVPSEIPSVATGLAFTFQSGESPERLEFTSSTGGIEFGDDGGDDEPNFFSHVYTLVSPDAATIVVTFKADKWDEYTLTYTSPGQGSFVRKEFKDGQLDDTDTGVFRVAMMPAGTAVGETQTTDPMPTDTLAGLVYTMDDGGAIPTVLEFATGNSGIEFDDSAPSDFDYDYTPADGGAASLVLRFKADKWDEYDLTFDNGLNIGSFVRREFDKNALKDTDSGLFQGSKKKH